MAKSHPVPKVGDTVVLNDHGLSQIFGGKMAVKALQHMKTLTMKITYVDKKSLTYPEETFQVNVNNKDINHFLIDHWCFDIVADPGERHAETGKCQILNVKGA